VKDVCLGDFLDYAGDFETDSENDEDCNGIAEMDSGGNTSAGSGGAYDCAYCSVEDSPFALGAMLESLSGTVYSRKEEYF